VAAFKVLMDIRFADHASFHRAAAGMVGGALVAGLALGPLTSLAPLAGGLAGLGIGAAWAYGHARVRLVAAVLAIAPLLAMTLGWVSSLPTAVPLVVSASLIALGLAAGGPRGARGAVGVGLGALVVLIAMWSALRIGNAKETMSWPAWLLAGASSAAMAMVGVLAVVPRHLVLASDPVKHAVRQLPALDPEIRGLCDRALSIWGVAKDQLADEGGKGLVRDGVLKTLEVAGRSAEVKATGASEAELARRMAELDTKIAGTSDAEAKAQYQAARAALDDQRRYREHIARGRERLVARMHNHVAALEKFQLAATGLEAARKVQGSDTIQQLADLSQDVAASGDALLELELETGPRQAPAVEPDAESGALA
jgi:hypothetical protein